MSPAQEAHLAKIQLEVNQRLSAKYRKGQAEHGGNLWDNPTLDVVNFAIDEAIDQLTYLLTIKEQLLNRVIEINHVSRTGYYVNTPER